MTKECSKCHTVYSDPISDHFQKKSIANDGFRCWCKICLSAAKKKYYKKNRKAIIARNIANYKVKAAKLKVAKQTLIDKVTSLEARVSELEKKVNNE